MKKKISITAIILAILLLLTGCNCEHEWVEANCITAKTCSLCEETEGAPLGHSWIAATCTTPKTCENCDTTEGEAKGHAWENATCLIPKKCSVCHETEGSALGHAWEEATTEAPKTCTNCQETEGSKLQTDPRFTTAATKELHGRWSCDTVVTGEMMGLTDYLDELPCTLFYEFGKTGEVTTAAEFDHTVYLDSVRKMTKDMLLESLADEGISKSDADEAMQAAYGMTVDEYVNSYIDSIDLDEIFGAFSTEGVYYVGQNGIYMSDSWYGEFEFSEYTLENGVLIIEEDTLEDGGEPLEWKKVEG